MFQGALSPHGMMFPGSNVPIILGSQSAMFPGSCIPGHHVSGSPMSPSLGVSRGQCSHSLCFPKCHVSRVLCPRAPCFRESYVPIRVQCSHFFFFWFPECHVSRVRSFLFSNSSLLLIKFPCNYWNHVHRHEFKNSYISSSVTMKELMTVRTQIHYF